jgi:hypothetical protein
MNSTGRRGGSEIIFQWYKGDSTELAPSIHLMLRASPENCAQSRYLRLTQLVEIIHSIYSAERSAADKIALTSPIVERAYWALLNKVVGSATPISAFVRRIRCKHSVPLYYSHYPTMSLPSARRLPIISKCVYRQ